MECGSLGQPTCSVAPATYESQKPKGCPDGLFFDPIDGGSCWSCPSGTVRQVTPVNSANACLRPPGETTARAKRNGRGTGLLRADCPKGQFWDPHADNWDPIPLADPLWRHFFIGYQVTVSGAKGLGGGISIIGVTDLRGNGGFYLKPQVKAVRNIGGGADVR